MVAAIGSSTFTSPSVAASPTAGLEAQIARYQKQLSDCVNCDSANTLQGKENIQQLSNKISAAKARIDEINLSSPVDQARRTGNSINAVNQDSKVATVNRTSAAENNLQLSGTATVGSLINVLA
jgi:hypothetical protein